MPVYLVDRDLNGITMEALGGAQRSAIEAAASMREGGEDIQYLRSTFASDSGRCMCLFEALDADTVASLNTTAGLPYERITEVLDLHAPG